MNLTFSTNFTIMPDQCNYMYPMVFGGAMFAELDKAAACCVNRLLHDSECDSAVTHKFEGEFHKPSYAGDIIFIDCEVVELRHKAIGVKVIAHREPRVSNGAPERQLVATTYFVFVARKDGEYHNHGLKLPA